jgi:hypothetical protein
MEKTLSIQVVAVNKENSAVKAQENSKVTKLNAKKDSGVKDVFDDLGEMEDLFEIYGEMNIPL